VGADGSWENLGDRKGGEESLSSDCVEAVTDLFE